MNIFKFLLIDAAIAFAAIPLLFLLSDKHQKYPFFRSSNKKKLLEQNSYKLPNKEKLLDLEKVAMSQGSGIKLDSLVGNWTFVSVWKKDEDYEDSVFSSLLRVFNANIEFIKDNSTENPHKFSIVTSIKFGFLSIEFSGSGYLKGKQPFLHFFFNLIKVKSSSSVLFSRSLKEPEELEKSIFELIALNEIDSWLSARGKGGALILWLKN